MQSHWRKAEDFDLPGIMAIAAAIHPGLPERAEVIAEKIRLCPDACGVLVSDGSVVGYGLTHFWTLQQIPPLDAFLRALPSSPDCLHVHDVALLPAARGSGATEAYVKTVAALARSKDIAHLALVSVYETAPFWARFGFRTVAPDAALQAKLGSYGDAATYMVADLGPVPAV